MADCGTRCYFHPLHSSTLLVCFPSKFIQLSTVTFASRFALSASQDEGSRIFSYKGPGTILGFWITQSVLRLRISATVEERNHRLCVNKRLWQCVPIKLYSQKWVVGHIGSMSHSLLTSVLGFNFLLFSPVLNLKNGREILKRQVVDQCCHFGTCLIFNISESTLCLYRLGYLN